MSEPTWVTECRAKGGRPGKVGGNPVCYLRPAPNKPEEPVAPTVFNGFSVAADFSRFFDKWEDVVPNLPKLPDAGDVVAGVTGIPKLVQLVLLVLVLWGIGVTAGFLPPMRKVLK